MSRPVVSATARLQARASSERRQRRMRLVRRTGWTVLGLTPLLVAGWVLLVSELLAVRSVSVTGAARLPVAQVHAVAAVRSGTPLAKVDTNAVASRLRALGPVASVSVTRQWPHAVRISIVERVPVVAERQGATFVLRDQAGAAIATERRVPRGAIPLVTGSPDATRAALLVLRDLPPALRSRVASLRAMSAEQVTLLLSDRRQVLWGGATDNAVKAAAVRALLRMPGRVYDVSAKGVVTRR